MDKTDQTHLVRDAQGADAPQLSILWHQAWHDGHAGLVPAELVAQRTLEEFRARTAEQLHSFRVTGSVGPPTGLCKVVDNKLDELFIERSARGTGAAQALLADAEAQVRAGGGNLMWLVCAIGNDRAGRVYEKAGWRRMGEVAIDLQTQAGPIPSRIWRYEKRLL